MELNNPKFNKSFLWKIIAIVTFAIMFIPMMYSLFYLGAFWDPYGSLKKVPVAFVNLDESYNKDGKSYTYGKDLENKLKDNDSFKWEFVSYNKAKDGVDSTSYYAMIVVPKDFSKKLANSTSGDFQKPQIIYRANKGRNFIFSQLSLKGAESIQNQLTNNISKETSKVLVDKLYDVKDSLKDASDAQNKIQDGTQKLLDGSGTLSTGIGAAYDGAGKLKTGLDTAATGSSQLQNGLSQLVDGQKQIVDGTGTLIGGLNTFKVSLSSGGSSMNQLVSGAQSTDDSMNTLAASLTNNAKPFKDNMDKAANGITQVADLVTAANTYMTQATADLKAGDTGKASDDMATAQHYLSVIQEQDIKTNIAKPLSESDTALDQYAQKASALRAKGTAPVAAGVKQAANTVSQTQAAAASGVDKLLAGATTLQAGSSKVYNGLTSAYTGSTSLTSGLGTAASSTGTLANGLGQLNDGAKTLNTSLGTLNDGTTKLKTGLNDGYTKLNDNLKFTSTAMSNFVSDPVKLSDQSINNVKKYGEGLAPYFISLSLWLGAMFINLVLTLIDKLKLTESKFFNSFIGKFITGVILVTVQATILAFSLSAGLGLDAVKLPYLYLNNIFTSIVFFSVMYGLSSGFGVMATPISFVLLILQLSACGGTFPIETAPTFYRVVGEFIPMTYTVRVVRMILSGINHSDLMHNISILLTFMFVFLIGGFLIQAFRNKIKGQLASKESEESVA
ncbi:YhgE/Pip domain-containing protein [Clostridium hydrogenum]|uniref:YhgE/Pip domain-containing protein n=1 Tax=Clostridium hydrogenum TaxID=2855764 RepID=UPI001F3A0B57|nr:YhgE/Pip domain-containing protein [Clostridium hydrogenum]